MGSKLVVPPQRPQRITQRALVRPQRGTYARATRAQSTEPTSKSPRPAFRLMRGCLPVEWSAPLTRQSDLRPSRRAHRATTSPTRRAAIRSIFKGVRAAITLTARATTQRPTRTTLVDPPTAISPRTTSAIGANVETPRSLTTQGAATMAPA